MKYKIIKSDPNSQYLAEYIFQVFIYDDRDSLSDIISVYNHGSYFGASYTLWASGRGRGIGVKILDYLINEKLFIIKYKKDINEYVLEATNKTILQII